VPRPWHRLLLCHPRPCRYPVFDLSLLISYFVNVFNIYNVLGLYCVAACRRRIERASTAVVTGQLLQEELLVQYSQVTRQWPSALKSTLQLLASGPHLQLAQVTGKILRVTCTVSLELLVSHLSLGIMLMTNR
jgi:hypothetical protein